MNLGRARAAMSHSAFCGLLVFTGRLLVTLAHLRTGLTHEALGVIYQAGSSTIGRAIGEIRPLLARPAPAHPGRRVRLRAGRERHAPVCAGAAGWRSLRRCARPSHSGRPGPGPRR